MIDETLDIQTLQSFGFLLNGTTEINATGVTIGKSHYAILGVNQGRNYLVQKLPAPLMAEGRIKCDDRASLRIKHVADDEGHAGCCIVMLEDQEGADGKKITDCVVPGDAEKQKKATKQATDCLRACLQGKTLPFDKIEDVKPAAGQPADASVYVELNDESFYTIETSDGEIKQILGSAVKTCSFVMELGVLRAVRAKDFDKITVSTNPKIPLGMFHCAGGEFGAFTLVREYTLLQPTTLKDALSEFKTLAADLEDMQKTSLVQLKAAVSSQEVAMREHKKKVNEAVRVATQLAAEAADPKAVKQLEDKLSKKDEQIADLKNEIKDLKTEMKVYEKIKAAAAALGQ